MAINQTIMGMRGGGYLTQVATINRPSLAQKISEGIKMGEITCDKCFLPFPASAIKYHEDADKYYCPDCEGKLEADRELALENLYEDEIKEWREENYEPEYERESNE